VTATIKPPPLTVEERARLLQMFPDHDQPEATLSNGHRRSCPCVECIQLRLDTWGLGDIYDPARSVRD
jgi:hypothetical protein